MARDLLSGSDKNCLDILNINLSNSLETEAQKTDVDFKPHTPKVRFVDEENITDRYKSTDEIDHAVSSLKKIHILKNRSSSETSILLRAPSLTKQRLSERRTSIDGQIKATDPLNNNSLSENLNGKIATLSRPGNYESENRLKPDKTKDNRTEENTKENDLQNQNFRKNCNVYSVHQAKTIISERRKSLPLSNIPKLIGHRVSDNIQKNSTLGADLDCLEGSAVANKDFTARTIGKISRGLGKLLRRSNSVKISEPDPVYKVAYLGNVLTGWARGDSCIEKPLATLWRNYNQSTKPDVIMKLSITNSGLKGFTKEHGLTEYWSHRITYCASPPHYPKLFCWVYRHEGRKLKHELRCHAVLCSKEANSKKITEELQIKLRQALEEFKKDKMSKQNARLSLANSVYDNPSMPRRKILLSIGANNYRPPLERSKSAPKLGAIEELCSEEDEEEAEMNNKEDFCKTWARTSSKDSHFLSGDERLSSFSLGRRRSEKTKSSRKGSLTEPIAVRQQLNCESNDDISFANEILELLVNDSKFNNKNNGITDSDKQNKETSQKGFHVDSNPKKLESQRSILGSIDESSETGETAAHCPVRDHKTRPMLGQNNFLVTDSDDGSVSSGCETASTVTSSDVESSSLPSQYSQEEFPPPAATEFGEEKVSVLQRVQNFERSYSQRMNSSMINFVSTQSLSEANEIKNEMCDHAKINDPTNDGEEPKGCDEVNHVPIGEKNTFQRRSTYPPLKNVTDVLANYETKFETLIDNLTAFDSFGSSGEIEVFKSTGDNDSACSDESGYSEFLGNGKESLIGNTIMV